jgi:hypothetical protein
MTILGWQAVQLTVLVEPAPQIAVVVQPAAAMTATLEVGQGPRGPAGPAGPAGATDLVVVAESAFGGGRVIASVGGELVYADCMNPNHFGMVVGVTLGAAGTGGELLVRTIGLILDSAFDGLAADALLRVGTNGLIVTEVPAGAAFAQVIGRVLTPGHIWVRPRPGIRLV